MNSRVVQRAKMKASLSVDATALLMEVKSHHFSLLERGGGCTHNVAMLDLAFQAAAQPFYPNP
jgi:hypothetical protein